MSCFLLSLRCACRGLLRPASWAVAMGLHGLSRAAIVEAVLVAHAQTSTPPLSLSLQSSRVPLPLWGWGPRVKSGMDNPLFEFTPNLNFKNMDKCFQYPCRYEYSEFNCRQMWLWDWWNPTDMDYPITEHGSSDVHNRISKYFKEHKWK